MKPLAKNRRFKRGDTIIEVLLSIAVIGVALGAGYALSSHSLRTGISVNQRSEALALAQGQVEFLKNAQLAGASNINVYATYSTQPFCIQDGTAADGSLDPSLVGKATPAASQTDSSAAPCFAYDHSPYTIQTSFAASVFKVVTSWDVSNGVGKDQLTLYYKAATP